MHKLVKENNILHNVEQTLKLRCLLVNLKGTVNIDSFDNETFKR